MHYFKKFWIVGLGVFLMASRFGIIHAVCVETIDVHYIKEQVNGDIFEHRQDTVNGACKETWLVNGKKVNAAQYEETILEAEKEVRRQERREKLEQQMKKQELKSHSQFALNKKILHEIINDLESTLTLLHEYDLQEFLIFDETFSKDSFESLCAYTLPEFRKLVSANNKDIELANIKNAITQLESVPYTLYRLFHRALDNATQVCSDTKKLKRLLELTI